MVKRQRRIVGKPDTPPTSMDQWVTGGEIDPEIPHQLAESAELKPQPLEEKAKAFPHRVSFDMESPQYKRLKRAGFEQERAMNEILRDAVEDWLKVHDY